VRVRPLFAWYDLWIGVYWDRGHRRLYILPIPCVGIVVQFPLPRLKPMPYPLDEESEPDPIPAPPPDEEEMR
jgi:hypothetical protein